MYHHLAEYASFYFIFGLLYRQKVSTSESEVPVESAAESNLRRREACKKYRVKKKEREIQYEETIGSCTSSRYQVIAKF